ncbi:MAG: sensor histidine kinase [Terrisporobacter sp.]
MAIKLKILNKDFNVENTYLSILSPFLMIFSLSIFLNTLLFLIRDKFDIVTNIFNGYGWYYGVTLRKFLLFGPGIYADARIATIAILSTLIISFILSIIGFKIYRKNLKVKTYFSNFITYLYKKLTIELPLLFIVISALFSINIMHREIYMYDIFVVYDAVLLFLILFLINYIIYNKYNLVNVFYLTPFIKSLFSRNNKKSINRKLAYYICISLIVETVLLMIMFNYTYGSFMFEFILFIDFFTLIFCISFFRFIYEKFDYIDYISKEVESIKNGHLDYKLQVKGKDQISSLAQNINNMSEGLGKAVDNAIKSEKMKTELITNVSHDLKTPLTSIISYVDMLKSEDIDETTRKSYLAILDKKSKRLKTLVEEIFEASKLSSGEIEFNIEKTDIKELLIQSIVELEDKIQESKLDFIVDTPEKPVFAMIDGKRTWRAFENLILNILKYSAPNSRVYIDLSLENNIISITFKNISNYRLNLKAEEFLERFRRGDSSRNTEGSGLGLSITQSIIELQNGSMDLNIDGDLFKVILQFQISK